MWELNYHSIRLTKRSVEALPVASSTKVTWDCDLKGFGVRISPRGRRTYFVQYRVGGTRVGRMRKPSIGVHGVITADEARRVARQWLASAAAGNDPATSFGRSDGDQSIAGLCQRYLEEHAAVRKKPASVKQDRANISRFVLPRWARRQVADIRQSDVEGLLRSIGGTRSGQGGAPIQANRVRSLLHKMFNLAEVWGWRDRATNPVTYVVRYPENRRERYLSSIEIERLSAVLDRLEDWPDYRHAVLIIRLLLFTGCRIGEILSLKPAYFDRVARVLRLPDSKTGAKVVYLSDSAIDGLEKAVRDIEDDAYLFESSKTGQHILSIKKSWSKIRTDAGLEGVRLHDLRHTFASIAISDGVPLAVIGKLLGHKSSATTERYAHLADDPLRAAVARVDSRISGNAPKDGAID